MLRQIIGWGVATWFSFSGKLSTQIRRYDKEGAFLPLVGHDPQAKVFSKLLEWLIGKGFSFVSTDELIAMRDGYASWRPRIAWLSFDDGWVGFKKNVLPVIEKYNIPVTLFIAPHETLRGQVWTNSIMPAMPYEKLRKLYWMPLQSRLAVVDPILEEIGNPRHLMSEEDIRALAKHPLVTIENHTYSHLSCSHRPIEEMLAEIDIAQATLTEWTRRRPRMVCYPFGHCTRETDLAIKSKGLIPVRLDAGIGDVKNIGACRNLFCDNRSLLENACRAVNSWVKVTVPDRE